MAEQCCELCGDCCKDCDCGSILNVLACYACTQQCTAACDDGMCNCCASTKPNREKYKKVGQDAPTFREMSRDREIQF